MHRSMWNSVILPLALALGSAGTVFAQTIDFEAQCPGGAQSSGPCSSLFSNVGNAQTLSISTPIGTVNFQGGALFDSASNLPADETAVYGTAGNGSPLGLTNLGTGFANPITITFPQNIHNFFVTVLNGNTITVNYQVSDNAGNSATYSVIPNLSGGSNVIGFPASGSVVTITALTGQSAPGGIAWDFFIDNVNFNQALPSGLTPVSTTTGAAAVPALSPVSGGLLVLGLGAIGVIGLSRKPKLGAGALVFLALLLIPISLHSADSVMSVKGVWRLAFNRSTLTLTIDRQNGSQFSGTIFGDRLRGKVSGEVRGSTLVFERAPQGNSWPADDSGVQRQKFQLTLVPACGGCSMIARGTWNGYGQGAASRAGDNLSASVERVR